MEMPPPRSWDPTAPSLLWAHEIRRENIHLADQLDNTKASIASAVTTTNALKQSVTELQKLVQQLRGENVRLDDRLRESESRASEKIESLVLRVERLQDENAVLRKMVDGFGRELVARGDTKQDALDEMRAVLRVEMEGFLNTVRSNHIKEPDLVPDSMPADGEIANTRRNRSMQASSQTTSGDSIQPDHRRTLGAAVLPAMKQNERTLAEYLAYAEDVRGRLPPRKREGLIVEAFLEGLDDLAIRAMLERRMDDAGWAWDDMITSLRPFIIRRQASQGSEQGMKRRHQKEAVNVNKRTAKGPANGGTARNRKKRPPIPIVPVDDEDVLY